MGIPALHRRRQSSPGWLGHIILLRNWQWTGLDLTRRVCVKVGESSHTRSSAKQNKDTSSFCLLSTFPNQDSRQTSLCWHPLCLGDKNCRCYVRGMRSGNVAPPSWLWQGAGRGSVLLGTLQHHVKPLLGEKEVIRACWDWQLSVSGSWLTT